MTSKSDALTVVIIGSVLFFIATLWNVIQIFIDGYYQYTTWDSAISYALYIATSLLLMIGLIVYRGTQLEPVTQLRGCPKCGRRIPEKARFCPYCGWQAP